MSLVIMKFGGTSLANTKLMSNAVAKILSEVSAGHQVIAVVSAMSGVTDHLVGLVSDITALDSVDSMAEYANVITTGEQISAGLFALMLQRAGVKARSWLGFQAGIITDNNYSDSDIISLKCEQIKESLILGYQVAVVAGFQGISLDNRISTLGRGGSDTTAIILSGALGAKRCDIYTDVEGVFTADPRIVPKARKLDKINYDEMIAFAYAGAKVLQAKSVQWAKHYQVKLQVLSSFISQTGTIVGNCDAATPVAGIALSRDSLDLDAVRIAIIGTNIDKNSQLIAILDLAFTHVDVLSKRTSAMMLEFTVKDEHKFDVMKQLHRICNLD